MSTTDSPVAKSTKWARIVEPLSEDVPQAPQESLQEALEVIAEIVTSSRDILQGSALREYVVKGMLDRVLEILRGIEVEEEVVDDGSVATETTPKRVINRTEGSPDDKFCYFSGGPLEGKQLFVPIDLDIICVPEPEYLNVYSIDQLKGLLPQDHWHRYEFRLKLNGEASDVFEYKGIDK